MKYLWMMVSSDKYELPLAVANTAAELGKIAGVRTDTICKMAAMAARGELKRSKYVRVPVKEDNDGHDTF